MNIATRALKKAGRILLGKNSPTIEQASPERIRSIQELAAQPLSDDHKTRRVEIIMLKFKEDPAIIDRAIANIIHFTQHPFKLTIFDNRLNNANTARAWNKLVSESSCDYICIIDSDAFVPDLTPSWLERMMESINETGVVVAMGDNVGGVNRTDKPKNYPSSRRERDMWTGICFLFKKEVWEKMHFDERFYLYGQESAWGYILGRSGGVILRTDTLVQHVRSHSAKKEGENGALDRTADKRHAGQLLEQIKREYP